LKLEDITPELIVDKFNKWLNRTICDVLRKRRGTGQTIVNKINIQERPTDIFGTKVFVEALEVILPEVDDLGDGMGWYKSLRRDLRKWKDIFDTLTDDDYKDLTIEDIAEYMMADDSRIDELLDILNTLEIEMDE